MRPIKFLSLFLLVIAAFIVSCSKSSLTSSDNTNGIVPLKVGNRWIGQWTLFDSTSGAVTSMRLDTTTIISEEMIGSERWFRISSNAIWTNRIDGYWSQLEGFSPRLLAKYPAAVGDTFGTQLLVATLPNGATGDTMTSYMSVVSTGTSVTVPAGTFNCYEYKSNYTALHGVVLSSGDQYYYYAPGKGMIKSEFLYGGIVPIRRYELVELDLK